MSYIDGFVAAVPAANKDAYSKHAKEAIRVFKELGAMRMVECWGDDVPDGKVTDFRRAVKAKEDEGRLLLDRMAVKGGARRRHEEDDGGSAHEGHEDALRRQAHDLRRVRADPGRVIEGSQIDFGQTARR